MPAAQRAAAVDLGIIEDQLEDYLDDPTGLGIRLGSCASGPVGSAGADL
jgi:hypothetical protein